MCRPGTPGRSRQPTPRLSNRGNLDEADGPSVADRGSQVLSGQDGALATLDSSNEC